MVEFKNYQADEQIIHAADNYLNIDGLLKK
jgi:hypothetical protein